MNKEHKMIFQELVEIRKSLHQMDKDIQALKIKVYSVAGAVALFVSFMTKAI